MHALVYAERPDVLLWFMPIRRSRWRSRARWGVIDRLCAQRDLSFAWLGADGALFNRRRQAKCPIAATVCAQGQRDRDAPTWCLTMGRTVEEAWQRMEAVEHSAKIIHAARAIGDVVPLPPPEAKKLDQLCAALGIPRPPEPRRSRRPNEAKRRSSKGAAQSRRARPRV